MIVTIIGTVTARAECRDELEALLRRQVEPTRAEPGCLAYGAFRSVRDLDEFYIHSRWQDKAAFERHAELPHTIHFLASIEPLLDHSFKASLAEQLW